MTAGISLRDGRSDCESGEIRLRSHSAIKCEAVLVRLDGLKLLSEGHGMLSDARFSPFPRLGTFPSAGILVVGGNMAFVDMVVANSPRVGPRTTGLGRRRSIPL